MLAVPAWHGFNVPITYDMLAELNPQCESVQGMRLMEKHFLIGETVPITILAIPGGGNFDTPRAAAKIAALTKELNAASSTSIARARRPSHPCRPQPDQSARRSVPEAARSCQRAAVDAQRKAISNNPECKKVYLSGGEYAGEVTRFDLVCDYDPFSLESMRLLGAIDDWLKTKKDQPNSAWHDVTFDFIGVTAGIRDLDEVNQSDTTFGGRGRGRGRVDRLDLPAPPPAGLAVPDLHGRLRLPGEPGPDPSLLRLVYGSTYQGLDWKLKIFLFVILVAVGEDYNIYLVTRVMEEQRRRGLLPGLREAVVRTGGIITSCGVIMAGTFGSMATGTLRSMIELGFAMSLGVLLDTFIIRTILVPAFLALLARWGIRSVAESRGDVASPHFEAVSETGARDEVGWATQSERVGRACESHHLAVARDSWWDSQARPHPTSRPAVSIDLRA